MKGNLAVYSSYFLLLSSDRFGLSDKVSRLGIEMAANSARVLRISLQTNDTCRSVLNRAYILNYILRHRKSELLWMILANGRISFIQQKANLYNEFELLCSIDFLRQKSACQRIKGIILVRSFGSKDMVDWLIRTRLEKAETSLSKTEVPLISMGFAMGWWTKWPGNFVLGQGFLIQFF